MHEADPAQVVGQVRALVEEHYVFPDVATTLSQVLAEGLAAGRYPADPPALATAVTKDLQSVNADPHMRLKYHDPSRPQRRRGADVDEFAVWSGWADQTCGGIAAAQRLSGNVGFLQLRPVLFPVAVAGERLTAALSLLASTDALLIDLRNCTGGDPTIAAFIISYLWDHEPVRLSGLRRRGESQPAQTWTLPYVPGHRFGRSKPVYVLTSARTFSGAEQVSYDLQWLGRAKVVGQRTRGGAHAADVFAVPPHLSLRVSVAAAVHPETGGNWEGTGVSPDVPTTARQARAAAYQLALKDVIAARAPSAAEARRRLAKAQEKPA